MLRNRIAKISLLACIVVPSGYAYAAESFDPSNEPQAWIAPIALSNNDLRPVPNLRPDGGAQGFRPWFESGAWQGDLIELDITATGQSSSTVDLRPIIPTTTEGGNWSARISFNERASSNADFWDDGTRKIVIGNGSGATPFRADLPDSLSPEQQSKILSNAQAGSNIEQVVNFIRGDRSNESPNGPLRQRLNILGDIIHSPPKYVAIPNETFTFDNYPDFVTNNLNREPRVYIGANDGMLHAFDAETGDEVFAYIPSMVTENLGKLSQLPYSHTYFVDGQIATGDVFFDDAWHTVLVGGLGAGGKGFYALDITDPDVQSETQLAGRILWEVVADDDDIGFSYSRPTITRLNDDRWYAVMGNGYNSANGKAKLLIIDIETGVIREKLETDNSGTRTEFDENGNPIGGNPNGLSSPSLIDTNGDNKADVAYAGDINGNLWKFDLSGTRPEWEVDFIEQPLLALGDDHPIIIPPDVVPNVAINGYFVYVGTGRAFTNADLTNSDTQSLYGVIDNNDDPGNLNAVEQTLRPNIFDDPLKFVRTTTTEPVDPRGDPPNRKPPNRAWRVDFPAGERFLTEIQTRAGRVQGLSHNPFISPAENWLTQPAFDNGGAPRTTILDLNEDGSLTTNDHVDGDREDGITAEQEDIPMGLLLGQGIRSRPTIAVINREVDTALINGLFVAPIACPERFLSICQGRLTDLDEVQDSLEVLQGQISALTDILSQLEQEFDEFITLQQELQQLLDDLNADPDAEQDLIDSTQADLDSTRENITNTENQINETEDTLSELTEQERQTIEFRDQLAEDREQRENGGSRDIGDITEAGIRSLGPNFALGRHSWVELEPE